ncbi:hypothetical protein [Sporichthya sp.]|uniref:hypothetical protein n=1 Tax=Sporichthya sp. TaxID=65475 RepID=UPI0018294CF3|nr:hypothetical protein [Sporichthya sp.]MBA3742550.1 hypothetical protein [Sporichthya sp.]
MTCNDLQVKTVPVRVVPAAGALTGAMISGIFGVAWTQWGASGISGAASAAIRVAGIVVGLVIVIWSARLRRSAPREVGGGSLFSSRAYRVVVALEVTGLVGGAMLLGAAGHSEYVVAWYATAVGVHFLAFGRLFDAVFYRLGAALIAAGLAGAAVGLAGGGAGDIKATSGLLAAVSLFAAGGVTLLRNSGPR